MEINLHLKDGLGMEFITCSGEPRANATGSDDIIYRK